MSTVVSSEVKQTLLKGAFVTPPALLAITPIAYLDNAWVVARNKAEVAGAVIAQLLVESQTVRPFSVVA